VERAREALGVLGRVQLLKGYDVQDADCRLTGRRGAWITTVPAIGIALSLLLLPATLQAQSVSAAAQSVPLPPELQPAIQSAIGPDAAGAKVTIDATTLEFWWGSPAASSWDAVEEGAVVGALRVTGPFREIRGKVVKPGVYTLRYGLQPQNGDHLGAAPNREFVLLSPAAADGDAAPLGFDGTVALAKLTTGTSHPASLSIDPPETTEAVLSTYTTDTDLKGVVFKAGALTFGLIVHGRIEH
jgi:hypothetical protein